MSVGNERSIVGGIRIDLKRLHETWMEVVYPRQRDADHTVLGKWKPKTQTSMFLYRTWYAMGVPVITLLYPLVLLGAIVRFQARRIGGTAASIGVLGVVLLSIVTWGTLTVLAKYRLDMAAGGITATGAAGAVATISAALAVITRRRDGRAMTVLLSYPFGVTAIFLPPIVAALFSQTVADVVLPWSDGVGRWILWNLLDVGGLADYIATNFEREGITHAFMWIAISFPLGWLLGLLVTLADLVRPAE